MNQVSPAQLQQWIDEGKDFALIDVRERWEHDAYNIGGTHLPMAEIVKHTKDLPHNKDVVLYCEKGIRSVIAIQRLEGYGFTNLINLAGGMAAWRVFKAQP